LLLLLLLLLSLSLSYFLLIQGGSNMTGTNCDLFTHKSSRSYLNHLVLKRNTNVLKNYIFLFSAAPRLRRGPDRFLSRLLTYLSFRLKLNLEPSKHLYLVPRIGIRGAIISPPPLPIRLHSLLLNQTQE
jgi:hypothetical protein